jgi:hypothetical protein
MTVRPEIRNQEEIFAGISRVYPPLLRSAGVGGTVVVNFFIDQTGTVRNRAVDRSSGHLQLPAGRGGLARRERLPIHAGDASRAGRPCMGYLPL